MSPRRDAPQHTCHARGCTTHVAPEFLMCSRHWWMVPAKLRQKIWRCYRAGQCDDLKPSREWIEAADEAIAAVAAKEGRS